MNFKKLRRWAALALAAALCAALLAGCSKDQQRLDLSVCLGSEPESLDPIYALEAGDQTILTHLYENLMRVTVEVSGGTAVTNGMAKSCASTANVDGTVTWTFRLRSAKWSDGKAVRAQDFVYAWQRLANPSSNSPYASMLSIVAGYDEVRATGDTSLLQVSAKNDTTFEVVLTGDYDWFLSEVCTSPATVPLREDVVTSLRDAAIIRNQDTEDRTGVPGTEKWWTRTEQLVTNGPYRPGVYAAGEPLTLSDNDRYYGTRTGPASLTFYFVDTAAEAQALYDDKAVDLIWPLTEAQLAARMGSETWQGVTELATCAALFNCAQDVFQDTLVRQALAMAIDRTALAQMAGVGATAAEGLVPSGVPGNDEGDFRAIAGERLDNDPETYEARCAQAKEYLAEAGYDTGSQLGGLEIIYVDEPVYTAVVLALVAQWREVLGLNVTPVAKTSRELRTALTSGGYTLALARLWPVGNDAECFLRPWQGDSEDNILGFDNSAYDTLTSIIAKAEDGAARLGCLQDAEVLLLEEAALAPLYTTTTAWTVRETITGVCRDARGWFCLSGVTAHVS